MAKRSPSNSSLLSDSTISPSFRCFFRFCTVGVVEDGRVVDAATEVRARLAAAIAAEDYEEAARLRDEIHRLTGGSADPDRSAGAAGQE